MDTSHAQEKASAVDAARVCVNDLAVAMPDPITRAHLTDAVALLELARERLILLSGAS